MLFFNKSKSLPRLFYTTDLHSHVCPGIDDGSPNRERSVILVRGMWELGFRRMIVTPHVTDEIFPNTPDILSSSYYRLTDAVEAAGIPMEFKYSAEFRMDDLFNDLLRANLVRPLPGGKYILVECGWLQPPLYLSELIYTLRNDYGWIPILAHPERYPYYQRNTDRYLELHEAGMLFQVNLLSLAGHYDSACKKAAEWLLENNLVSFVGSDLHRSSHLDSIRRYLTSRDYRKLEDKADLILNDTAFEF